MSCPSDSQPALAACHRQRGTRETGCGCCHADGVSSAGLWRMPAGNDPLEQTAVLRVQATQVRAAAWHPQNSDSAVTVEDRSVVQWRFEGASAEVWRGSRSVIQHAWHLQQSDSTASVEERPTQAVLLWPKAFGDTVECLYGRQDNCCALSMLLHRPHFNK